MDTENKTSARLIAESVRVVEYLRSITEDASMNARVLEVAENSSTYNEAVDEAEAMEIMSQFTADGDEGSEEEVDRILNAKTDMTFDEMIGISENISPDECASMVEDALYEGANADIRKLYKEHIRNGQKKLKTAKKYIKAGKYDDAKKLLNETIKEMEMVKKVLKEGKDEDTNAEKCIGDFITAWKNLVGAIAIAAGILINNVAPVIGTGVAAAGIASMLADYPTLTKVNSGTIKLHDLKINDAYQNLGLVGNETNTYRALNFQIADEVISLCKRLIKEIDNKKKFSSLK